MRKFIDLHLHLDGSVPVATVKKLMREHDIPIPTDQELRQELSVDSSCKSLEQFLEKFALPNKLMQTRHDLDTIVYDLLTELKEQGLVYAEIRFAPQLHTKKGLTQEDAIKAAIAGLNKFLADQKEERNLPELHAGLILCLMRFADNQKELFNGKSGPHTRIDPDGVPVWNGKREESIPPTKEELKEMKELLKEFE